MIFLSAGLLFAFNCDSLNSLPFRPHFRPDNLYIPMNTSRISIDLEILASTGNPYIKILINDYVLHWLAHYRYVPN